MKKNMMMFAAAFFGMYVKAAPECSEAAFPMMTLTNDLVQVDVLLPDAEKGYYRGVRFDWSGIVAQVHYGDATFFMEWQGPEGERHDPLNPGAATGTAEEFRDPLGYEEAGVGDPFLKIGVGVLERATNEPYHFAYPYRLLKAGTWAIETQEGQITFVQEITTEFGYAYRYEKTVVLSEASPEIEINHTLTNTGEKAMHCNPYCHNFFSFDDQSIDQYYRVVFPDVVRRIDGFDERVVLQKNYLQLREAMSGESWTGGHVDPGAARRFALYNDRTGSSVDVLAEVLPQSWFIFMSRTSFCVEPMIRFDLKPAESFSWKRTYRFGTSSKTTKKPWFASDY